MTVTTRIASSLRWMRSICVSGIKHTPFHCVPLFVGVFSLSLPIHFHSQSPLRSFFAVLGAFTAFRMSFCRKEVSRMALRLLCFLMMLSFSTSYSTDFNKSAALACVPHALEMKPNSKLSISPEIGLSPGSTISISISSIVRIFRAD